jgi:hypothetical protein
LHTAIEQQFGKQISADAFFARPTFATLLELVAGDGPPLDKRSGAAGSVALAT